MTTTCRSALLPMCAHRILLDTSIVDQGYERGQLSRRRGVRSAAGRPCGCRKLVRAVQAACSYSWRTPPRRSRRRMLRCVIVAGSVIGSGSGCSGRAFEIPRWGRCALWCCSYSCKACSRWRWFQISHPAPRGTSPGRENCGGGCPPTPVFPLVVEAEDQPGVGARPEGSHTVASSTPVRISVPDRGPRAAHHTVLCG
jgi:hypothetical protein